MLQIIMTSIAMDEMAPSTTPILMISSRLLPPTTFSFYLFFFSSLLFKHCMLVKFKEFTKLTSNNFPHLIDLGLHKMLIF